MVLKEVRCENGNWIHAITKVLDTDSGPKLQTPKFLEAYVTASSGRMGELQERTLRDRNLALCCDRSSSHESFKVASICFRMVCDRELL
jgi:hypothetical protein